MPDRQHCDVPAAEISDRLTSYLNGRLAENGDLAEFGELTTATPLAGSGLTTSLETARLLAFMQREFGVRVPAKNLLAGNFESIQAMTVMLSSFLENTSE